MEAFRVRRRATRGVESRTEVVHVRMTKAERVRLEQRAAAAGLTVSAYAAQALADGRVTVEHQPAQLVLAPDVVAEFKRVGNNLNQIAHALNAFRPVPEGKLAATVHEFLQILLRNEALDARAKAAVASMPQHGAPIWG
jgi:hypothetical protein